MLICPPRATPDRFLAGERAAKSDRMGFRAEAAAAGSRRRPNTVQLYESGGAGGRWFFSMEYVEGKTLKQWLVGAPNPAPAAVLLLEALARTVAYAHRFGVIRRDPKVANVLDFPGGVRATRSLEAPARGVYNQTILGM
jgi:eukaryotic-like serine/threonine-protein kinase